MKCSCGTEGRFTCSKCQQQKYCSAICQKLDWKGHRLDWIGWMCRKEGQRLSCGKCRSILYCQRGANNSIGNSDIKTCVANLLLSHWSVLPKAGTIHFRLAQVHMGKPNSWSENMLDSVRVGLCILEPERRRAQLSAVVRILHAQTASAYLL